MQTRQLICIRCPLGCALTVTIKGDGSAAVTGNTCERGEEYGKNEVLHPRRTLTSTVRAAGHPGVMVPVKTASEIPKEKIEECMQELKQAEAVLPVSIGDVIVENVAGTGVPIVATKNTGL